MNKHSITIEIECTEEGLRKFLRSQLFTLERDWSKRDVFERYKEPGRFYHNMDHMLSVVGRILARTDLSSRDRINAIIAGIYHDCVYSTNSSVMDNEKLSADAFQKESFGSLLSGEDRAAIVEAIMATKDHLKYINMPVEQAPVAVALVQADLHDLSSANLSGLIELEAKIFQEYKHVGAEVYRAGRLNFLERYRSINPNIDGLMEIIRSKKDRSACLVISKNSWGDTEHSAFVRLGLCFDRVIVCRYMTKDELENNGSHFGSELSKAIRGLEAEFWTISSSQNTRLPALLGPIVFFVLGSDSHSTMIAHELATSYPVAVVTQLQERASISELPENPLSIGQALGSLPIAEIKPIATTDIAIDDGKLTISNRISDEARRITQD